MIPVLLTTYNRLEYSKKALASLIDSDCDLIYIYDNYSNDGTQDWIYSITHPKVVKICFSDKNDGISGAMNWFLNSTRNFKYVFKVDNDTIVPKDFFKKMLSDIIKEDLDLMQAKHFIIPATNVKGWDGFVVKMQKGNNVGIYINHFIGGSGIVFKRDKVKEIPHNNWVLGAWRQFQQEHPELKKGFTENVEIKLLDEGGYEEYPEYYKETGRLKNKI